MTDPEPPAVPPPHGDDSQPGRADAPRPGAAPNTAGSPPSGDGPATHAASATAQPPHLEPGAALGPYHIVEAMQRDGQTVIFKAFDQALARHVAIRVLPAAISGAPGLRDRFERDAIAVSRLRHPNILTILDFGEEGDITYLVTEFVDGSPLADLIGDALPLARVLGVLNPVASALDYAHALGIVHGDVKPSNILIDQRGAPILTDFGLGNVAGQTIRTTAPSATASWPPYTAPEQLQGEAPGPAADQYALAAIAFALLTGRPPDPSAASALAAPAQSPPRVLPATLPPGAAAALGRALALHPDERFPSVGDFMGTLAGGATPTPTPLGVPTPLPAVAAPRSGPLARFWPFLLGVAAALLLAIAVWRGASALAVGRAVVTPTASPSPVVALVPAAPPPLPAAPTPSPTEAPAATPTASPSPSPTPSPTPPPTATPIPPTPTVLPPTPAPGCAQGGGKQPACQLIQQTSDQFAMGYVGAEYFIRTTEYDRVVGSPVLSASGDTFEDVVLSVDVRLVGDTASRAITFGCRAIQPPGGTSSGYVFYLLPSSGQTNLLREGGGTQATLQALTPSTAVKRTGATNHVELRCIGNAISAVINGVVVVRAADPAPLRGAGSVVVGVANLAPGNGAVEARFSNLRVTLP